MFNGKRPTALYYNRELQNLRGPLHFGGERSMNLRLTLAMPPHCLILGVAQHELSMQQSARHFCFAKDSCRRWHFAQIQISIPELPFFQRGCLGIQEWSSFHLISANAVSRDLAVKNARKSVRCARQRSKSQIPA